MTQFTYEAPNEEDFLFTLHAFFDAKGSDKIAALLTSSKCKIQTTENFSHRRWDAYAATFVLYAPTSLIHEFTEDILQQLWKAVEITFPPEAGYDIIDYQIAPFLERHPTDDKPLNLAKPIEGGIFEHDGLRFRSKAEIRVYDELKKRDVLFFPNATAALGGKNDKREPDFLVCQDGKWGILEVMGGQFHPSETAIKDHERARIFKDYGLTVIEFYDAKKCYQEPQNVVDDFLNRLLKF